MTILGIGSDIADIRRIEDLLKRFGPRFETRSFTQGEIELARARGKTGTACAATLAKRFAAKEAFAKALGSGLTGMSWQEVEVVRHEGGRPTLRLHGEAKERLDALANGRAVETHLSLADEYPYAQAFVVISAAAG